jgi:hypothetical protein
MNIKLKLITTYDNKVNQLLEYLVQLVGFISRTIISFHINVTWIFHINVTRINQAVNLI